MQTSSAYQIRGTWLCSQWRNAARDVLTQEQKPVISTFKDRLGFLDDESPRNRGTARSAVRLMLSLDTYAAPDSNKVAASEFICAYLFYKRADTARQEGK